MMYVVLIRRKWLTEPIVRTLFMDADTDTDDRNSPNVFFPNGSMYSGYGY